MLLRLSKTGQDRAEDGERGCHDARDVAPAHGTVTRTEGAAGAAVVGEERGAKSCRVEN